MRAGESLHWARAAMILLHGRGGSAESILDLASQLAVPGFAYLAPQASGHTWYPVGFMSPIGQNEPELSSALGVVSSCVEEIVEAGTPAKRIFLLGFSQGACLTLEFAARNAQRFGGVVGLSGGLIGPEVRADAYRGSFDRTPVFLGCSDSDIHIPKERVLQTAEVFERMGADVRTEMYPDMGHTTNEDEMELVRTMMISVSSQDEIKV